MWFDAALGDCGIVERGNVIPAQPVKITTSKAFLFRYMYSLK